MKKQSFILFANLVILSQLLGCGGDGSSSYIQPQAPRHTLPSPAPVSVPAQKETAKILEAFYQLCEQPGYDPSHPFCLSKNLRNIRQLIQPYEYRLRGCSNKITFCDTLNRIIRDELRISHFYISPVQSQRNQDIKPYGLQFAVNQPSKVDICENGAFVHLQITDFRDNFNYNRLISGLVHAANYNTGIIVDLRDNLGGKVPNLKMLFNHFFDPNTVVSHYIDRSNEPFLGDLNQWIGDYSKNKMNTLIRTIESNWTGGNPWEILTHTLSNKITGRVAILINENSSSCSEHFTMALKEHYPGRVKIIGKRSRGSLLSSINKPVPELGIQITYPIQEVIGVKGTRVEGVGINPDEEAFTSAWALAIAKAWVRQTFLFLENE